MRIREFSNRDYGKMKFTLEGSRYDESTYLGRFQATVESIDPRLLLVREEQVRRSAQLLQDFEANNLDRSATSDQDLWEAKRICDAVIHPTTGQIIHPLGRMAGFVPVNIPLVAGMLNSTGILGTAFWQWANQSYNSALNYANRSGNTMSDHEIITSYGIAVGTSVSIALAARWLGKNGPAPVRRLAAIPFVVPYLAVASAGAANVYFTRRPELVNGVQVVDGAGKELGISKEAARQSVFKTILSRSIGLPIPVLILPHIAMSAVPKSLPPRVLMFTELTVITASLMLALPAAIAIFPQQLELDAAGLEEEFQQMVDAQGRKIERVYCNKGL